MSEKALGQLILNADGSHADDCLCHECGYGLGAPQSGGEDPDAYWNPQPGETPSDALKRFAEGHGMEWRDIASSARLQLREYVVSVTFYLPLTFELEVTGSSWSVSLGSGSLSQMHGVITALKALQ